MNEIDQQTVHLQHLFLNWIVLKILHFYYLFKESDVKNNQHQSIFYNQKKRNANKHITNSTLKMKK